MDKATPKDSRAALGSKMASALACIGFASETIIEITDSHQTNVGVLFDEQFSGGILKRIRQFEPRNSGSIWKSDFTVKTMIKSRAVFFEDHNQLVKLPQRIDFT